MSDEPKRFVFVDIETTGLDEDKDLILEIGLRVTDENLQPLGEWSSLVLNDNWRAKLASTDFVWNMHVKSGLTEDLDKLVSSPVRHAEYHPTVISYVGHSWLTNTMGLAENTYPLCGSSVHFDRDFLKRHMIVLLSFFTYRNIDVSTLKELCKLTNPELAREIAADPRFKKENAKHRVLPDLDGTIAELKVYMDNFLFIPGNALESVAIGDFESDADQLVFPGMEFRS